MHEHRTTTTSDRLWTVVDVAKRLNKSEQAVYHMVRRGLIPFTRVGMRSVRFDQTRIEEWLAVNTGFRDAV